MGARPYLARALQDYGLALRRRGETEPGEEALRRAAALFGAGELGVGESRP
jgi:Flp pilus assembly protein TadD